MVFTDCHNPIFSTASPNFLIEFRYSRIIFDKNIPLVAFPSTVLPAAWFGELTLLSTSLCCLKKAAREAWAVLVRDSGYHGGSQWRQTPSITRRMRRIYFAGFGPHKTYIWLPPIRRPNPSHSFLGTL